MEKAIASLPDGQEVIVRHRAFQLQPDLNQLLPTSQLLASKYKIDIDQVTAMQANVCSIADGEGLCYDLSETLSGNTADAHRLILWAQEQGNGDALLEALYSAYFEKKRSIFTHDDLLHIAGEVGLDAEAAKELLNSDRFSNEVAADQQIAAQLGATGVPFYVIDMKYGISGAQPQEHFDEVLKQVSSS